MACQGQVQLAPNGQVVGIDLNVALQMVAARCCDIAVISELLPAAEAGMVHGMTSGTQGSG